MDCCLCDQSPHFFRPRNSICMSCFEGAKEILEFASRLDLEEEAEVEAKIAASQPDSLKNDKKSTSKTFTKPIQGKGLADAIKHIKQLEQAVGTASKQISYLGALGEAFTEGFHADLELATDDGLSIQVHKVIMATRSSVFRTMLEMDSYKEAKNSRVRIPDISHVELKHLVEFMYTGQLRLEALQDHSPGLMFSADKYDVPLLIEICEAYLIDTMNPKNALEVLEVATRLSSATALKDAAMSTIVHNSESILFSREYEDFAMKNPLLAVRVSQSVMQQLKSRLFLKPASAQ
ncbi:hypothetical protein GOP47_0012718 [Adiantum capillus-veneris]|uniref:BTB domain-containing protein n=1 Tax=Adiantum capillus-veneris TaxID=13818 RepID=A0A9D4USB1_ADICA|nr:hypothetical protein GOP47_0012718 [Adiantum capillus-veneris]